MQTTIPPNQPLDIDEAEIFGYNLKKGQLDIIGSVLDPDVTRLIVSATTQYGKTQAVAIGILTDLVESDTPKKVLFIAPTIKQTNIIRNYVAELITDTPELSELVDQPKHGPERLKSEMSRERLTFKNDWEIITLTAHGEEGGQDPGKQLMGFGGDIIVLDEACLILDEIYRKRIKRMLGSNPKAKLIILANPWKKGHFAYKAWKSKRFRKIHIGWQQAIEEGRVTREFIEEQREDLTPIEFKVLYDSEFPDDNEDALIMWSWIEAATIRQINFKPATFYPIHSLDVAEKGTDLTILTDGITDGENYQVKKQTWIKVPNGDTMLTTNKVSQSIPKEDVLNVDSIGVGAGVYSRLKELGFNVASIRVGESPTSNPERFENLKAQRWWELRTLFEKGKISIPNDLKLMTQLSQMGYEITNKGKIKIIDPEGKSPDFADSLMLLPKSNKVSFQVSRGPSIYQ